MMKRSENPRLSRQALAVACVVLVLGTLPGWASARAASEANKDSRSSDSTSAGGTANRDVDTSDLKGIGRKHRYYWALAGGAAVGAGIGALAPPGSGTSATKGMLIGGSFTSFLYLATHHREAGSWRPLAWIATNAILGAGIGWASCNCMNGFGVGAGIGGGVTTIVEALKPRHRTLSRNTGASQNQAPPPQQQQPPVNPPPQQQQPQSPPPNSPQANPPQTTPPPDEPPDAPEPKPDR